MQRLEAETTALIVVDIQERLASAMPEEQLGQVVRSSRILCEAARALGAPVFLTEQYPKGLGSTLPEVAAGLGGAQRFEKLTFSAWQADGFEAALRESGVRAAVVVGMEAHVCVFQTVRDLLRNGIEAHVPIDGVSSRRDDHRRAGLRLCEGAGALQTTTETVVFDWLERAGGEHFKALSKLIR
jgi:nicotinamidase-related amidase